MIENHILELYFLSNGISYRKIYTSYPILSYLNLYYNTFDLDILIKKSKLSKISTSHLLQNCEVAPNMKVYDSIEGDSIFPVLRQILESVHRP